MLDFTLVASFVLWYFYLATILLVFLVCRVLRGLLRRSCALCGLGLSKERACSAKSDEKIALASGAVSQNFTHVGPCSLVAEGPSVLKP